MTWLGILSRIRREGPPPAAQAPTLTQLAFVDGAAQVSDRDVRIVRDVAEHVTSKVVPIVELHGRTMETALQANVMAIEVALRLALEAAQRTALTAVVKGEALEDAIAKLDAAILTIVEGLGDHRPALAEALEAAYAGIASGSVRS